MKKMIALLLALVMIAACFAGCAPKTNENSDLAYVQEKGKLLVGITDYEPMDYKDADGNWIGFDADVAKLFAEELGVECEFIVLTDWSKKFYELNTKNIDVIWNGMTITDEAKSNASVSDPYVINAQVLVTEADVADQYKNADAIKDLAVAVENGSAGQDAATAAGVTNIVAVGDQTGALLEVAGNTSDACVVDITLAKATTGEGKTYPDLAIAQNLTEEEYGVAFRTGSDITAKLNAFFDKLAADGKLQELADKYGVTLVD